MRLGCIGHNHIPYNHIPHNHRADPDRVGSSFIGWFGI